MTPRRCTYCWFTQCEDDPSICMGGDCDCTHPREYVEYDFDCDENLVLTPADEADR